MNGIGEKLEKRLWETGILTWDDFIRSPDINFLSPQKKEGFDQCLSSSLMALGRDDAGYFASAVRRREHWRLFDIFKGEAACLDIETNGFMPGSGGFATVVGLYDGFEYKCFVKDETLTAENLKREFSKYKYIITFYGTGFDIPFLMRSMPNLKFNIPHFDLCFGARKLGFKGGLKKLEVHLGIKRHEAVKNFDGYDAIKLWESARRGSSDALELLKVYNREDTVNLYGIAETVYERLRAQTGIEEFLSATQQGIHANSL